MRGRLHGSPAVLVVDDNVDLITSQDWLLQAAGYDVRIAQNGEECLDRVACWAPDVILLDIAMPQLSGFELCRRLKAHPNCRDAIIVAYTGMGGEEIRTKIYASGFDGLLVKPVDWPTLEQFLSTVPINFSETDGRLCGATIESAQGDATD